MKTLDNTGESGRLIENIYREMRPELLEAHLEQDPMARNEAAEIGETLRLALAGQPAMVFPVLRPSWPVPSWAWGMAACFVCGLSLGIFTGYGRNEPPRTTASIPGQKMSSITTADESDIWSARRFRAGLLPSRVKAENRIIWKSPVRKPEIF